MASTLRIQLLGGFGLSDGETPITSVNTPRLQAFLAYLVLHRTRQPSRQQTASLFWPDSPEGQARTNLRNLICLLRQALPRAEEFLCVEGGLAHWRADAPFALDVAEFEQAFAAGAWAEAAALYQGDLLPGCYDDWVMFERERLEQMLVEALTRRMQQLEAARDYRGAIACARRRLRYDPLHEETYRRLMELYALGGEPAMVAHTYQACAAALQRELGIGPSLETSRAYEHCLRPRAATPSARLRPAPLAALGRLA